MIKAVLFDLDGVLVDAREWHYIALNRALNLFGMEISRNDHLITFEGLPTLRKLELLSRDRGLPESLHAFINQLKQKYTIEEIYRQCQPSFPIEYAVSRLQAENYKLAVCSNSVRKSVEVMLERSMIIDFFDLLLSNEDVENPKPAPDMYIQCMKQLAISPEETLIIEDSAVGIEAAQQSGAHVLTVNDVSEVNYATIQKKIARLSGC